MSACQASRILARMSVSESASWNSSYNDVRQRPDELARSVAYLLKATEMDAGKK